MDTKRFTSSRFPLKNLRMPTTWIARFLAALLLSGWGGNLSGLAAGVNTGGFPYSLRVWGSEGTEEARLPQSSVISIIQSRQGYLWLGTLNGLVRFDGLRFTVFDEASNPELGGRKVVHIFEDSRQNLWIGTDPAGITVIDKSGGFRHLNLGTGRRGGVLGCERHRRRQRLPLERQVGWTSTAYREISCTGRES